VLLPFLGILAVLLLIFLAFSLSRFLADASEGSLPADTVLVLTLLKGVIALETLVPVALYIAVIVGLGGLYSNWEMTALKATGLSEAQVGAPLLMLAMVVAVGVLALSFWGRPWAYDQLYGLRDRASATSEVTRLEADIFHWDGEAGRLVFMEDRQEDGSVGSLFVRTAGAGFRQVITAAAGTVSADEDVARLRVDLADARAYRQRDDSPDLVGAFGQLTLLLPESVGISSSQTPKRVGSAQLRSRSDAESRAEWQWRQSTAVSQLLLVLLAVPLSRTRPRGGRFARVMLAVVTYATYYNLLGIARTGVEQQATATLWWAPGLLAAFIVVLLAVGRNQA